MKHRKSSVHRNLRAEALSEKEVTRTYLRAAIILPYMIKKRLAVHNGCSFVELIPTADIVGYRLGEFARTRKRGSDPRSKSKRIHRFLNNYIYE